MAWVSKSADEWNVVENGKVLKGPFGTKEEAIKAMDAVNAPAVEKAPAKKAAKKKK